jgi:2,5-furandicarboxylate decarboxylase 1
VPVAPVMPKANGGGKKSVADTLAAGPASFFELMIAAGSRDGREIVRELDVLYAADKLTRNEAGRYVLKGH